MSNPVFACLGGEDLDADAPSSPKVIAVNPDKVGWQPTWDGDKLLQSLDDEINDVLEVGTPKSSLLGSLNPKIEK